MLALWTLFPLLLFTDTVWRFQSFMHTLLPGLYDWLAGVLPAEWREASVKVAPMRAITLFCYFAVVCALWIAYVMAVRAVRNGSVTQKRRPLLPIMLGVLAFSLPALLWPAMFSDDVFAYSAQGKMQVVHGFNPLVDPPARMGNDPLVNLSPWRDIPTTYGPVWLGTARGVAEVAQALGGRPVTYLLLFKLLNVGLLLAGTALVWAIGAQLAWTIERRASACVLFGWCPLMQFDLIGSAHNDALLVLFILCAVWLHLRGWWPLAVGALMLGGLVKLSGFFLLPAYVILVMRSSKSARQAALRGGVSVGVAAAIAALAYLPYAHPDLLRSVLSNPLAGAFGPSVGLAVRQALVDVGMALRGALTPADLTVDQAINALQWPIWNGALLMWGALALGLSVAARDFTSLIRAWALIIFSYLVIASVWFMPWYVTWLVPIAALLSPGHLPRAVLLLAWGGSLFYALTPSFPWDSTPNLRNYYVPGVIFLPPLLYLLAVGLSRWAGRSRAVSGAKVSEAS